MKQTILDNGLKVITEENEASKVCTIGYIIASGSYDEMDNERGIAHLVEHMLFKGTTHRTYQQVNNEIESIGGYLNAETNFEYTKYYCTVPYDKWNDGLDVMSDILFNHTIPNDELRKEKKVVQEELKMYLDDPSMFVSEKLIEKMFSNYPNRQSIGGTVQSVENISRDNIIDFITRNYFPENITLLATGNVNHNEIVNFINSYLDNLNINFDSYQRIYDEFTPHDLKSAIFKYDRDNVEQAHIAFGLFGPAFDNKDALPLDVATTILGGNGSSALYENIREKKGLAYSVHMEMEQLKDVSIIMGYAGLNKENDIISDINEILKNALAYINDATVEAAKSYIIGMLYLKIEKTSGLHDVMTSLLLHDSNDTIDEMINKIKQITTDDVINVTNKYFTTKNICYVTLNI